MALVMAERKSSRDISPVWKSVDVSRSYAGAGEGDSALAAPSVELFGVEAGPRGPPAGLNWPVIGSIPRNACSGLHVCPDLVYSKGRAPVGVAGGGDARASSDRALLARTTPTIEAQNARRPNIGRS